VTPGGSAKVAVPPVTAFPPLADVPDDELHAAARSAAAATAMPSRMLRLIVTSGAVPPSCPYFDHFQVFGGYAAYGMPKVDENGRAGRYIVTAGRAQ
jgi:hypothetical protein